ncbi:methyltransferase domain-containing protein [bacterium]|nr:methyltransferase domain-containing protein [bacterium]
MTTYNLAKIRKDFSQAAPAYEKVAELQRAIALKVAKKLGALPLIGKQVADLGIGTGFVPRQCKKKFQWVGLDLAEGMLQTLRQEMPKLPCVLADMEQIPFADASMDAIVSSLAVQWLNDPLATMCEMRRILKPGGHMVMATFVPPTLHEMVASWKAALPNLPSPINPLMDVDAWQNAARNAGFKVLEAELATHIEHYGNFAVFAEHLKGIGAGGKRNDSPGRLTPGDFQQLAETYERHFADAEGIRVSWHSYYLSLYRE